MPFEIPQPQEVEGPAKVGAFQEVADAVLRGCALTDATPDGSAFYLDGERRITHACVWTAFFVGRGARTSMQLSTMGDEDWQDAAHRYNQRYSGWPVFDYVGGRLTREQIAARIAAL
jgi:hypothetical protein